MPYTENGVWIPYEVSGKKEAPEKKVADRPHPLTICLALIQPIITICAVLVAWRTLNQNDTNFRIASAPNIKVEEFSLAVDKLDKTRATGKLAIKNVGQTTANNVRLFGYQRYIDTAGKVITSVGQAIKLGSVQPTGIVSATPVLKIYEPIESDIGIQIVYETIFGNTLTSTNCLHLNGDSVNSKCEMDQYVVEDIEKNRYHL